MSRPSKQLIPELGLRVRMRREICGYGVRDVARRAGLSAASVSRVEREVGDCQVSTVAAIAEVLNCSVDWLVRGCSGDHQWVTITRCSDCGERK